MAPFNKQQDQNYDKAKINFFDIFGIHLHAGSSVEEFYDQYRNLVVMNLKRSGDIILWQNGRVLDEDEELSPTFEDMILANVLGMIDSHLLEQVRENYSDMMGKGKCLMDYKENILDMASLFLSKKDGTFPAASTSLEGNKW